MSREPLLTLVTKYKKYKHPISTIPLFHYSTIPPNIRAGIRVAIQPWWHPKPDWFPPTRPILLLSAGRSRHNQPPGMPTTCRYFCWQRWWVDWVKLISSIIRSTTAKGTFRTIRAFLELTEIAPLRPFMVEQLLATFGTLRTLNNKVIIYY